MKQKGSVIVIAVVIVFVTLSLFGAYFLGTQTKQPENNNQPFLASVSPTTTNEPIPTSEPTPTITEPAVPLGWQTYENTEYGFRISYPSSYQALDDANNLYGWSNGIVLIYSGGQSYDLPIEVWDTVAEYQTKYQTQMSNLTAHQLGNKYITLLNANQISEVNQIIATFEIIN